MNSLRRNNGYDSQPIVLTKLLSFWCCKHSMQIDWSFRFPNENSDGSNPSTNKSNREPRQHYIFEKLATKSSYAQTKTKIKGENKPESDFASERISCTTVVFWHCNNIFSYLIRLVVLSVQCVLVCVCLCMDVIWAGQCVCASTSKWMVDRRDAKW